MVLWITQVTDFVEGVVEEMKQPAVVMGNSIGCIATLFAARNLGPEKVKGIVFMNAAGNFKSEQELAIEVRRRNEPWVGCSTTTSITNEN